MACDMVRYSRWGNAGQLQLSESTQYPVTVIADGGMRANCNRGAAHIAAPLVIADGGMRANCNLGRYLVAPSRVIADGGMRANCNRFPDAKPEMKL